jgi:hypothetical protein
MTSSARVFCVLRMAPFLAALGGCGGATATPSDAGGASNDSDATASCAAPSLDGTPVATVNRFDTPFPIPANPGGPVASGTYVLTEVDVYGQATDIHIMPVVMVMDASAGTIAETWQSSDGGVDQSLVGTYMTSSTDLSAAESPSCGTTFEVGEPYSAFGTTILLYVHQDGSGILWTYAKQ